MFAPVLQRYGMDLALDPDRLRNLVEHHCRKHHLPLPDEAAWLPVQEQWLLGWPQRGSSSFLDRYRQLRSGLIRALGGHNPEGWLDQLPAITVLPEPRGELEVGLQPGAQPNLAEALLRLGRGGRLLLDGQPQQIPPELPEAELHLLGTDTAPGQLDFGPQGRWRQGWLRLENFELRGKLVVEGGLVELRQCRWQPGSRLVLSGVGAYVQAENCDFLGPVQAGPCTLLEAYHCNFESAAVGLEVAGLARLRGVGCSDHPEAALRVFQRGRVGLEDCQLRASGLGLEALGQCLVWMKDCWVRDNLGPGIQALDAARLELLACQLRHNGADGLALEDQARLRLEGCQIAENQGAGVRLDCGVVMEQSNNRLHSNQDGDWLEMQA